MGMVSGRRTPGVQYQGGADARPQVPGIGGDGAQRLRRDLEQQSVEHALVVPGERGDQCRQGEDDIVILDRQQFAAARFEPAARGAGLALRAVAIAARVVGNVDVVTGVAAQRMYAQHRAAALLDVRHDLELAQAQVPVLSLSPGRTVGEEDVRDLQARVLHGAPMPAARCQAG